MPSCGAEQSIHAQHRCKAWLPVHTFNLTAQKIAIVIDMFTEVNIVYAATISHSSCISTLQVLKEWAEKWAMGESISEFFQAGFWNLSDEMESLIKKKKKNVSSSLHFTQNIRGILHFIIINLGNVTFYVTSAVHYLHILSFDLQLLTNVRDCCVIKTRKHRYVKTFSQTCLKLKITVLFVTQITK